jgi:hypothetical protein
MSRLLSYLIAVAILAACAIGAASESPIHAGAIVSAREWAQGFAPLFNGRDLSGWRVMGSESWSAKEGELVCSGEGHGWIRTDALYRDFVLRLEYKVWKETNSGIFLRAKLEGDPAFTGMEVQVLEDYGEPPDKHSNGSLYDAVAPAVNPSKPIGEWNQVEITMWGNRLTVAENGRRLYSINLFDPALNAAQSEERKFPNRAQIGYIGLQDHGSPVAFRNIRISEGFVPIFNGRDLEDWKTVNPDDASWSAREGVLACDGSRGGYIYDIHRYGDFALRIQYRISPKGNSGVFFRVGDINDFPGSGAEVQVLDSYGAQPSKFISGAIYDVIAPTKNAALPTDQWNQFEIACWKGKLSVVMNGEKIIDVAMADYPKLKSLPPRGYIGLQNHGQPVEYRDIRIKTASWIPPMGGE